MVYHVLMILFYIIQGGVNAALGNMEPDDWKWHM